MEDSIAQDSLDFADYAFRLLKETKHPVFLTGRAGTGKSTFLRKACRDLGKKYAIVAPTGIAAINVRGETIHSFFKVPFGPLRPGDPRVRETRYDSAKRKVLESLELLVIDEVSMVRADLLDAVDDCLRRIRKVAKPFGGVQVLLVGDLLQLEPVARADEWAQISAYYDTPFFFSAKVVYEMDLIPIELEKVYRQSDPEFIGLLDRIRMGAPTYDDMVLLNRRPPRPPHGQENYSIVLTGRRDTASMTNEERLQELPGKEKLFKGTVSGDFPRSHLPTEKELHLKPGAQVIFVRNDPPPFRRWVNGTLGVVESIEYDEEIDQEVVWVKLRDDTIYKVERVRWENIKFRSEKGQIKEDVVGFFDQLPLRLAWAVTIHKSQGLTFERAVVDLGNGAFASGQLYTALSRVTAMEGLYLKRKIRRRDAMAHQDVLDYYDTMNDIQAIQRILDGGEEEQRQA